MPWEIFKINCKEDAEKVFRQKSPYLYANCTRSAFLIKVRNEPLVIISCDESEKSFDKFHLIYKRLRKLHVSTFRSLK